MAKEQDDKLWQVKQVAEYLGVTDETVLGMIHSGRLPASNINTSPTAQRPRWRIRVSDIKEFLQNTSTGA